MRLTGEMIHVAWLRAVRHLYPHGPASWSEISEERQGMYNAMAAALNEQLAPVNEQSICSSCGQVVDPDSLLSHACPPTEQK
jgi:hypothetical protein